MDDKAKRLFTEINRLILLLRSGNTPELLDELEKNTGELKKLWAEQDNKMRFIT